MMKKVVSVNKIATFTLLTEGDSMQIVEQKAEFITCTPEMEKVIEYACRTCYRSHNLIKEGSAEKLFNQIVKQNHHDSVCEHANITLYLTTDRSMLAQITRHRIGFSFSVESQRYCNYTKDKFGNHVSFIKPEGIEQDSLEFEIWQSAMQQAEIHYQTLLKKGCKPEVARSVLPNSTKVELTITGNIRAWRHFFQLRASGHAQKDIQVLCTKIYNCMLESKQVPSFLFDDCFVNK